MLIITNCLTETADEGCLKTANSIVERIKAAQPETTVVSYERKSDITDFFLTINKLFLNRNLFSLLRKKNEPVLYIPFPSKPIAAAIRIFVLSLFSKKKVNSLLVMMGKLSVGAKLLLKISGTNIIVISKKSENTYRRFLPSERVKYIKMGVDTKKFMPVTIERAEELKIKYGFDSKKPIVLHVGHMKKGRNVGKLVDIEDKYNVLLVASTLTANESDPELVDKLSARPNIRILDDYIDRIEEIYQLSDVYFFPTVESGNCIDVPLSCLEAASCNKSVVTTDYGEMSEFIGCDGFHFLKDLDKNEINYSIDKALECRNETRKSGLEYDWDKAILSVLKFCES